MLEVSVISWSLLVVVIGIIFGKFHKRKQLLKKLEKFIGPPSIAILGNSLDLNVHRREVLNVLQKWINEYGSRLRIFLGIQPYIMLTNASDAERILSSPTQIEKSGDYELLYPWLGTSLLTGGGKKWFHRRKQLTPAFHFKILDEFLKVFNDQCFVFKKTLEENLLEDKIFNLFPVVTLCALDIICESAMGTKINAQQKSNSDYVKAVYTLTELLQYRILRPWLHPDIIWNLTKSGKEQKRCIKILHAFTEAVIRERKKDRREEKKQSNSRDPSVDKQEELTLSKKKLAFLDLLLETQETDPNFTDVNLREETDTFMFEGHDTTSAAVSWTTFLLSCNPEQQARVHEELDAIFGNDREREVTIADIAEMKYLDCCIKESLRIYPSVPFIGRKLTNDLELEDGSVIPASCIVWVLIYFLHRDPNVFPDPEKFDPERFSPENIKGRHPFSYVPFSGGPRNCIGQKFALMEEKVMLATIFRNFKVVAIDKREDISVLSEVITRPEHGLHVKLEKR